MNISSMCYKVKLLELLALYPLLEAGRRSEQAGIVYIFALWATTFMFPSIAISLFLDTFISIQFLF